MLGMYGVWSSVKHFSDAGSIPAVSSDSLDGALIAALHVPVDGRKQKFVARMSGEEWCAVGFISAAGDLVRDTTSAQLDKYDKVRRGQMKWSNNKYRELTSRDHPRRTVHYGAASRPGTTTDVEASHWHRSPKP